MTLRPRPAAAAAAAALLVFLSLLLRAAALDARALHFDEGNNVFFGLRAPADVLRYSRETFDTNPPAHRFALGAWMALAGPSPFSIRFFSALCGALAVALLYRVLRELALPAWPSLAGAAMLAVSPYAVNYAQEAKGYAMTLALALASWWAWLRLSSRGRAPWAAAYAASTALMLAAHYYTLPLLAMQWLWSLAAARAPAARARWPGLLALQALACLPAGAWAALTLSTALTGAELAPGGLVSQGPLAFAARVFGEAGAGQFAAPALASAGALIAAALAIAGGYQLWRQARAAFWFGAATLVALAAAFALQLRIPFFHPRFLLYAWPGACALVAGCCLNRRLALIAPLLVGGVSLAGLAAVYRTPAEAAFDLRPIAAEIKPLIQPGDAMLGAYIWMQGAFTSYLPETQSALTWYADAYSPQTIDALMTPIAQRHDRAWSLGYRRDPDSPDTLSIQWLKSRGAFAARMDAGQANLVLFAGLRGGAPEAAAPQTAVFDGRIRLSVRPISAAAEMGDAVVVPLTWTALEAYAEPLSIFVHLVGPDGTLVAQSDGDAVNGLAPSHTWEPGRPVLDRRAVLIRRPLAPGPHTLWAGLYRRGDGQRLRADSGADRVAVGIITAKPGPSEHAP